MMAQGAKKTASKRAVDPYKAEVAGRVYQAFMQANAKRPRDERLTQAEVGRLVATELGLAEPFLQSTVSTWMNVDSPAQTDPLTLRAIGKVLDVDVMWLLYGAAQD